jgi:SMP-30/Gluconolactonase/LRE-like region
MTLLVDDFVLPNGLAFSPGEKLLYVNDSRRRHIRVFELWPNGTLAKQTNRVFNRGLRWCTARPALSDLATMMFEPKPPLYWHASHSRSFDHRLRVCAPLTAIASAFRCPTSTTKRFPRVTPV